MGKGKSLHIGLNFVDPHHYDGWDGKLNACENDASDMENISRSLKFETKLLLREKATRNSVKNAIEQAGKELKDGDIFYISYSGHGGQLPDRNEDEPDGRDETWCLFDGELVDDELRLLWKKFAKGVRIFVTSDSCHSGSIIKSRVNSNSVVPGLRAKFMNTDIGLRVYSKNYDFYEDILRNTPVVKSHEIKASVLLISGCQDNQYSYDGDENGSFTSALKIIWNGGKFIGDYPKFHRRIVEILPSYQTPNYMTVGFKNYFFEDQKPFTI